jgi:hypothetical protein
MKLTNEKGKVVAIDNKTPVKEAKITKKPENTNPKLECLSCYAHFKIPKHINNINFEGDIRCPKCKALLGIKFEQSNKPIKYWLKEKADKFPNVKSIVIKTSCPKFNECPFKQEIEPFVESTNIETATNN